DIKLLFYISQEDLHPSGGGCLWDYAASSCFFAEGNAVVTDITGNKLDLNPLESIYMNHCGIVFASHQKIANSIYQLYQYRLNNGLPQPE
ncbi:MAG: hypothetical protein KZQ74_09420, partial [gamma proteobacterium symbiont of Bathyaustriella thionipta]|nr:hypothetical protein [gamma proteobacterium symbiont of Bathyaustriella thionipta]